MELEVLRSIPVKLRFREMKMVELDGVTSIYVGNKSEEPVKVYSSDEIITSTTIKTLLESLEDDNRLDASAIKNLPEGGGGVSVTTLTKAELDIIVAASGLEVGAFYNISDKGILMLQADSINTFNPNCTHEMWCANRYAIDANSIGIWHPSKSADVVIGINAVCANKVYKNLTGNIGNADEDPSGYKTELNILDWEYIDPSTMLSDEYIKLQFNCKYDYFEDWIYYQEDALNNKVTAGVDIRDAYGFNSVEITDWNYFLLRKFNNNNSGVGIFNIIINNPYFNNTNDLAYNDILLEFCNIKALKINSNTLVYLADIYSANQILNNHSNAGGLYGFGEIVDLMANNFNEDISSDCVGSADSSIKYNLSNNITSIAGETIYI
jgi:hypothetical protein